jgi:hypothetical protein
MRAWLSLLIVFSTAWAGIASDSTAHNGALPFTFAAIPSYATGEAPLSMAVRPAPFQAEPALVVTANYRAMSLGRFLSHADQDQVPGRASDGWHHG